MSLAGEQARHFLDSDLRCRGHVGLCRQQGGGKHGTTTLALFVFPRFR
jgi:hypothetical protein